MSTHTVRAALDAAEQHATAEVWAGHPLAIILGALIKQTRAALAAPEVGSAAALATWLRNHSGQCVELGRPDWARMADRTADALEAFSLGGWIVPTVEEATLPAPEPGEVGELVAQLGEDGKRLIAAGYANTSVETRDLGIRVTRAATLIQQQAAPAPPEPEPGEVGELAAWLRTYASEEFGPSSDHPDAARLTRAAALLSQQAAPTTAVVPVAVSEWEDGFMGGVCVALATVTAHGASTVWREIVRSVGVDNLLNYAANVSPEDWDLAGFSEYAQPELGKGKPLPPPQGGEGEA